MGGYEDDDVPLELPAFVEPMLAEPVSALPTGPDWILEPKLDGYRGQIHKDGEAIRLLSREGNDLSKNYPEVIGAAAGIGALRTIVDGEIVAIDAIGNISFAALQGNRRFPDYDVVFFAFDMMFENDWDVRSAPWVVRREHLLGCLRGSQSHHLRLCPEWTGDVEIVAAAARQLGIEGLVAKKVDSIYRSGVRSHDWRKQRFMERETFIIGGFRPSGADSIDVLVVGSVNTGLLRYVAKVHSGLVSQNRRELRKVLQPLTLSHCPFSNLPTKTKGRWGAGIPLGEMSRYTWVQPVIEASIEFLEWTPEGRLRHPAFVNLTAVRRG